MFLLTNVAEKNVAHLLSAYRVFYLVFLQVEIKCMGQPVIPTLQLYNLVDLWLQTASTSERVSAMIGSSAKDFVMVLTYARKVQDIR